MAFFTSQLPIDIPENNNAGYPALLDAIKNTPRYNDAAWLLKYQIESMLDIYKRLM